MEDKLNSSQEQYLKGVATSGLPIIVSGKDINEVDFVATHLNMLGGEPRQVLHLQNYKYPNDVLHETIYKHLEYAEDKIIVTHEPIPTELDLVLNTYLLLNVKRNKAGHYSFGTVMKEMNEGSDLSIRFNFESNRTKILRGRGDYELSYLIYDERGKLKKNHVKIITSLSELEEAREYAVMRRALRKSHGSLTGKSLEFPSSVTFEVHLDAIEGLDKVKLGIAKALSHGADYADIYVVIFTEHQYD